MTWNHFSCLQIYSFSPKKTSISYFQPFKLCLFLFHKILKTYMLRIHNLSPWRAQTENINRSCHKRQRTHIIYNHRIMKYKLLSKISQTFVLGKLYNIQLCFKLCNIIYIVVFINRYLQIKFRSLYSWIIILMLEVMVLCFYKHMIIINITVQLLFNCLCLIC